MFYSGTLDLAFYRFVFGYPMSRSWCKDGYTQHHAMCSDIGAPVPVTTP